MFVCLAPVLGNCFAVTAASPEFIARATAESCLRWSKKKVERENEKLLGFSSVPSEDGNEENPWRAGEKEEM